MRVCKGSAQARACTSAHASCSARCGRVPCQHAHIQHTTRLLREALLPPRIAEQQIAIANSVHASNGSAALAGMAPDLHREHTCVI